jgi:hypothetical protein
MGDYQESCRSGLMADVLPPMTRFPTHDVGVQRDQDTHVTVRDKFA